MIYDISTPLNDSTPVYPGDPLVQIDSISDIMRGDEFTLSQMSLSLHAGTHIDAPSHFISGAASVDKLSLSVLIGDATLADIPTPGAITAEVLEKISLAASVTRLLLHTLHCPQQPDVTPPALSCCGAEWLVARGIKLVGIDRLSIGFADQGDAVHQILLGSGVVVVESLDLAYPPPGEYQLICLPLNITAAEAAPARAILIG